MGYNIKSDKNYPSFSASAAALPSNLAFKSANALISPNVDFSTLLWRVLTAFLVTSASAFFSLFTVYFFLFIRLCFSIIILLDSYILAEALFISSADSYFHWVRSEMKTELNINFDRFWIKI